MASAPVAQAPKVSAPVILDLDRLHTQAQTRIKNHPAGVGHHGIYTPLGMLVTRGKQVGGAARVEALAACQDVLNATDAELERALLAHRPAPNVLTGQERANAIAASQVRANQAAVEAARPRVTLSEQLGRMEAGGIRMAVHHDDLQVTARNGLTEADRTFIRENKPAILAWLNGAVEVF